MVETRRSSASTSNKRLSSSPPPSSSRSPKRSKEADAAAPAAVDHTKGASDVGPTEKNNSGFPLGSSVGSMDQLMNHMKYRLAKNLEQHRSIKEKLDSEIPWGKLLSQYSENPHIPISSPQFTVGHNQNCNLRVKDSPACLCKLKLVEQGGTPVVSLEMMGSRGVVRVNGKIVERNSNVILTAGDEAIFSSSGKHAYIFQQLSNTTTPTLPSSHSIAETVDVPIKELTFESRLGDPSPDDEASLLASFSNLSKDVPALPPHPPNESTTPELDLSGSLYKTLDDQREILRDIALSSTPASTSHQAYKDNLKAVTVNASDIEVSFESFPYYLRKGMQHWQKKYHCLHCTVAMTFVL